MARTTVDDEEISKAAERLAPYLGGPSPVFPSRALSDLIGTDVWVKVETATPVGSFKLRGALNALLCQHDVGTVVTSSSGNHGQAVAYAAKLVGAPCHIFVPDGCVAEKLAAIRALDAELFIGGEDIDSAKALAQQHCSEIGGTFIDDGENAHLIAGAGTVGEELANQVANIDVAILPMASGSLVAGTAIALKAAQPAAKVWAVQSSGSPAMVESFHARRAVERCASTAGDCLACRVPAELALRLMLEHIDEAFLVDDDDLFCAMGAMLIHGHLLVEPGASAALALALKYHRLLRGRRVVLVATGANCSVHAVERALASLPTQANVGERGRAELKCLETHARNRF